MTAGARSLVRLPAGYARCFANREFRRMQPGFAISFLGDGMSTLGVAWLALRLAGPTDRGALVGLAVAAYTLPSVIGSFTLGRWLSTRSPKSLILLDSLLRGTLFTLIPVLDWLGLLHAATFIILLALSSLLHAWGIAGRQTFAATSLPPADRLAGNSLLGSQEQLSYIAGPPLAGLVTAALGPATVLAFDAASYLYLALMATRIRGEGEVGGRAPVPLRRAARTLARYPGLVGLLALTFAFNLLYGPIEVALPVFVSVRLGGHPALLGWIWGAFGVGAVFGALITGTLRRLPLWPTALAIVAGWGLALLPLAELGTFAAAIGGFALGGLIYAPYGPVSVTLLQQKAPPAELVTLTAFRSTVLVCASPLGAGLGGLLVTQFGAVGTIRLSSLTTIGLAVLGTVFVLLVRLSRRRASDVQAPVPAEKQPVD